MSKKILFFGNETLATGVSTKVPIFRGLIAAGYQIEALVISAGNPESLENQPIVKVARQEGIIVLNISSLRASIEDISRFGVDTAVLAAYGRIVPQSVLDLFKIGIINVHPSLLPKHRGSTPVESAILNGESETGVTIMKLAKDMDAGPIYAQQRIKLRVDQTKQEIADKLDLLGRDLLLENLEDIINGKLLPKHQPNSGATYDKLITKGDGEIDWLLPAEMIIDQIRAYANWPKSTTLLAKKKVIITKARKFGASGIPGQTFIEAKQPGIYCGKGAIILEKLIPEGKKEMSGESFLAGYKI